MRTNAEARVSDSEYWLLHCEGFRVDGSEGRIGVVEEVREDSAADEPLLVVRAGVLGRRVLLIPTSEVVEIVPRALRIWLRSPVAIAASEPLRKLRPRDAGVPAFRSSQIA